MPCETHGELSLNVIKVYAFIYKSKAALLYLTAPVCSTTCKNAKMY